MEPKFTGGHKGHILTDKEFEGLVVLNPDIPSQEKIRLIEANQTLPLEKREELVKRVKPSDE